VLLFFRYIGPKAAGRLKILRPLELPAVVWHHGRTASHGCHNDRCSADIDGGMQRTRPLHVPLSHHATIHSPAPRADDHALVLPSAPEF